MVYFHSILHIFLLSLRYDAIEEKFVNSFGNAIDDYGIFGETPTLPYGEPSRFSPSKVLILDIQNRRISGATNDNKDRPFICESCRPKVAGPGDDPEPVTVANGTKLFRVADVLKP